jgi:hypothetical protein
VTAPSVRIATDLALRVTRIFDDAGATQLERHAALTIAEALVSLSEASLTVPDGEERSPSAAPGESPGEPS